MPRARQTLAALLVLGLAPAAARADVADPGGGALPDGTVVVAEGRAGSLWEVYLDLPADFLLDAGRAGGLTERWLEGFQEDVRDALAARGEDRDVRGVLPWAIDPRDPDGPWVPLVSLLPAATPPAPKPGELPRPTGPLLNGLVWSDAPGASAGALSGKVVYVSAGHGFTWTETLGRWATQRGNTNEVVEDLISAETIDQYLIQYLANAGATVFTVRERDMNPRRVIVDAEGNGQASLEGAGVYVEEGGGFAAGAAGFRAGLAPYQGEVNPFAQGGTRAVATVSGAATATARWTPTIPADGYYRVAISYTQAAGNAKDAHFVVRHPGGDTDFRVNQERHGNTWVDLGRFWFYAGQDPARGSVLLLNDSALEPGDLVVADAVRFGGGMGDAARGDGTGAATSPTSGRPKFEECSRYHAQFNGAPTTVYARLGNDRDDDVSTRSRYAAWQNESGEDAVYVAWHTNAPNPGRGTSTYVYGPNPPNGTYDFTGAVGSDVLAQKVHGELVSDIRAALDPSWQDRGINSAYFGEVNPTHNNEMPSVLVEVAFHDTPADATWLKSPRFRQVAARAFYQGIVKYFAQRDGKAVVLAPDAPVAVAARAIDAGSARVTWSAPPSEGTGVGGDAPTSYKVYTSHDGRSWDNGVAVTGTSWTASGLAPGVAVYYRVAGVNAGGESFPSTTVGVATGCPTGTAPVLVVYGFTRLDASSAPRDDLSAYSLGSPYRLRQDEMNTFGYVVEHGAAWASAGVPFDSAEATAVGGSGVPLGDYAVVDWVLGEESTVDETLSDAEQAMITAWRGAGGARALVTSGAELLWDLDEKGSASDKAFAAGTLGATYLADRAETQGVVGAGALAGVPALTLDDGTLGTFDVYYPDVLTPVAGAQAILSYDNGAGAAGVLYRSGSFAAVTLGAPIEALYPASARNALVAALADELDVPTIASGGCGDVGPADPGPEPPVEQVGAEETAADTVSGTDTDTAIGTDTGTPGTDTLPGVDALVDGAGGAHAQDPFRQVSTATKQVAGEGCGAGGAASPLLLALAAL
ncbi:MAG: N-acetylmuramoyl-L-alanine amidase, partial [Myxococcales bacterium]|nr:N-acetylmuramoyl-L-alanine amidase [Myxococcales bacterium]